MKRRLLALLLAVSMMGGSLLPAYAEEENNLLLEQTFGTSDEMEIVGQVISELTGETEGTETTETETETEGSETETTETETTETETTETETTETETSETETEGSETETTDPENPENPENPEETEGEEKAPWEIVVEESFTVTYGDSFDLTAECEAELTYESADETVAEVDEEGHVTIVGAGVTTVTVTAAEDEEHSETAVEVEIIAEKAQRTIELTKTSFLVKLGSPLFSLGAVVPACGTLTYKTSDSTVVAVSKTGNALAKKCGKAVITVTCPETENYEKAQATITVTVYTTAKVLNYSGSYKKSRYYKALMALKLTGTTAQNIVSIALSQVGYHEGSWSGQLGGNGTGSGNYTEYARYYGGMNPNPWCAMFVSWCAREAGVSTKVIPKYAACASYKRYYCKKGQKFYTWAKVRKKKYVPKAGDLILYSNVKGGTSHHIGYVTGAKYTSKKVVITTVEGNSSDQAKTKTLTLSRSGSGYTGGQYLLGIAHPKY